MTTMRGMIAAPVEVSPPAAHAPAEGTGAGWGEGREAGLLRVFTCGSVDDGKSTLIGRLLHDSKALHEDQIEAVAWASAKRNADGGLDLSLITDGLRAEREQGITIDVAYRFFATARRRFILADTPGHVQYTRNMATGASTADVAIILIDARNGIIEQTRRHACVAALLGVPRLYVCVNKMDLVGFDRARFGSIRDEFLAFARSARPDGVEPISQTATIEFVPISALRGDNVVEPSKDMPWTDGPPLLARLESVPDSTDAGEGVRGKRSARPSRFPIQYVLRPQSDVHHDYRGYAGRVAGGSFAVGDEVAVLPSGFRSRIAAMNVGPAAVDSCGAGRSVAIQLADDVDASRGDMIVPASDVDGPSGPMVTQDLDATLVWMDVQPLAPGRRLLLKHTTRQTPAVVRSVASRLNVSTMAVERDVHQLALNEIGSVRIRLSAPIVCDPYARCRETGAFILIDERTNNTVAAGMIRSDGGGGTGGGTGVGVGGAPTAV